MLLNARLKLKMNQLKQMSFFKMFFNFMGTPMSMLSKMLCQGIILKFVYRLKMFKVPPLLFKQLFYRTEGSILSHWCMLILHRLLLNLKKGELILNLPDKTQKKYGDAQNGPSVTINVNNYNFFKSVVFNGELGFAKCFIKQQWETNSLMSVFELYLANKHIFSQENIFVRIKQYFHYILFIKYRRNTIKRSKQNVADHYDLGNDFFKLFLDKNRLYSSAIFKSDDESIEDAQINKNNDIIRLADIQEKHHILEIGSGWGALALHIAKTTGARVTTVTISSDQYNFVKQKINKAHMDNLVEVKLMDYRLLTGKYDRIVSVEMLEAVGHHYLALFFDNCYRLLRKKGRAVFQSIMMPKDRYLMDLKRQDFIQRYIFPRGPLPCLDVIKDISCKCKFNWASDVSITKHYVKTFSIWEQRLIKSKSKLEALGFDLDTYYKWLYYFNYSAVGFDQNFMENHQFVIEK